MGERVRVTPYLMQQTRLRGIGRILNVESVPFAVVTKSPWKKKAARLQKIKNVWRLAGM